MKLLKDILGLFYKPTKKVNPEELNFTMNTTSVGEIVQNQRKNNLYNIATLNDSIKSSPTSSFPRYMMAEILLDKGDLMKARKEFLTAEKIESTYTQKKLSPEEKSLKKIAKAKIEKKLGHKL